jgi:hypothetical protein
LHDSNLGEVAVGLVSSTHPARSLARDETRLGSRSLATDKLPGGVGTEICSNPLDIGGHGETLMSIRHGVGNGVTEFVAQRPAPRLFD